MIVPQLFVSLCILFCNTSYFFFVIQECRCGALHCRLYFGKKGDKIKKQLYCYIFDLKCTQEIAILKREVRGNDTIITEYEIDAECDNLFIDIILKFLRKNKENQINPYINTFPQTKLSSALCKVEIDHNQWALIADIEINQNIVIGQLIGIEYTEKEFNDIFRGPKYVYKNTDYAIENLLTMENGQKHVIILDQYGLSINKNIDNKPYLMHCMVRSSKKNNVNINKENCHFITVNVNGWPSTFLLTKKLIKMGEQLMVIFDQSDITMSNNM